MSVSPFDHWLSALEDSGDQATVGFDWGTNEQWPEDCNQWPQRYLDRLVIRLASLDPAAETALARARNLHARQIAVWIDTPQSEDLNSMLGLGFKRLIGPADAGCYGYDLDRYNHTRDWNNAKYWANPERWGKDFW